MRHESRYDTEQDLMDTYNLFISWLRALLVE
jgi:hypothetical protein